MNIKKITVSAMFLAGLMFVYDEAYASLSLDISKSNIQTVQPQDPDEVFGVSDEVEIDFENDEMRSAEGINMDYGNMKIKVLSSKRDKTKNRVYLNDESIIEVDEGFGKIKIETKSGEASLNGDYGIFRESFGYLEVGAITGAEAPNTRIYFGGNTIEYRNGKIIINKGWITTDFNIAQTGDPKKAGYHIISDRIIVEPDKQITIKKSDLYIGKKDVFPFKFPWYRTNIRSGSEVPLFPVWGDDEYYGSHFAWGVLYGDKKSKFKGGIAPKYADKMGLLIGRMENWYKTDKMGTAKFNVDDWLIYSKVNKIEKTRNPMEYEHKHKRYRLNFSHEYNGEHGTFYFDSVYGTYNMMSKLDDLVDTYESRGWFDNPFDARPTKRPKFDKNIGFYSLNSSLKNLGPQKDIYFNGKMKLTDDKKGYALMVYDEIDDIGYGSLVDHDLFSQFELYKDNQKYRIGGYYNYLYDMDPGSTFNDTRSRAEDFGFEAFEKKHNIGFSYDEKNGDKYRRLGLWERDPNMDSTTTVDSPLGSRFSYSYNPTMIREYVTYDSKDLRISLGEYHIKDDIMLKIGVDQKSFLRELDTDDDPLRSGVINNNNRDKEYNRYENIIYQDFKETRGHIVVYNDKIKVTLAAGETKDTFLSREGLYDGTSRRYVNESKFYEIGLERDMISLGKAGELALSANVRYDKYDKGYNAYLGHYAKGKDSTLRTLIKAEHVLEIFNNKDNNYREWDASLNNDLQIAFQGYKYDKGNINFGDAQKYSGKKISAKEIRLEGKENYYQITDKINYELGNTITTYTIDYKKANDAGKPSNASRVILNNSIETKVDNNRKIYVYYNTDKNYTDERIDDKNYNYLTYKNYGISFSVGQHTFGYSDMRINSDIEKMKNTDDAKEKIKLDTFSYQYKFKNDNILNIGHSIATDKRHNITLDLKELDVDNKTYFVQFIDAGEIEKVYTASYGTYEHRENQSKWLVIDGNRYNSRNADELYLSFDYRDKRFDQEDLKKYGAIEYNKSSEELTAEEIEKVRDILLDRNNKRNLLNFNISRIRDDEYKYGDYKRRFRIWVRGERNKARYDRTGNYFSSLQEISGGLYYSHNRIGIGYVLDINNGWQGTKWKKTDREHKIAIDLKIGKPSKGWQVRTYAKFYENLNDPVQKKYKKRSLDGLGIEIGKEFDYYQWSVAYETGYSSSAHDYEWKVAVQFKLLTFPTRPILGIGAKKNTKGKTAPNITVFDGIKPENILSDDDKNDLYGGIR